MEADTKTFRRPINFRAGLCLGLLVGILGGCATGPGDDPIYVPVGGGESDREQRVPEPRTETPAPEAPSNRPEPRGQEPQREAPRPTPSHRTEGQAMSPAATGLVQQADQALRAGNISGGMTLLQRAQRISPDASAIYYKMAEGYVLEKNLPRAEQFASKGISVAGSNQRLQKAGWQLLSDIRRARGNVAGADQAEERASAL